MAHNDVAIISIEFLASDLDIDGTHRPSNGGSEIGNELAAVLPGVTQPKMDDFLSYYIIN